MRKNYLILTWKNFRILNSKIIHRNASTSANLGNLPSRSSEAVKILVPWGHIAGKWYGSKHHGRPIVGLHGWQDNAGTFDTLAPLLPHDISFLSLDMPGHGLSSRLPDGLTYHTIDYVALLRQLLHEFKWDKISIIGHSMSSINGFVFSALFPDKIDMLIGIDILKPLHRDPSKIIKYFGSRIEENLKHHKRMHDKSEPPVYDWEELKERLHLGTDKSISMDSCKYILERNVKPSASEPQKFYFSRDARLKSSLFHVFPHSVILEMARRIKCPYLFIKASQAPYFEEKKYFDETIEVLRDNPNFEYHEVDGTHHVHLNEPEKVVDIINPFITKWRK